MADDDLFADSDDDAGSDNTDDLIATAKLQTTAAAAPKKRLQKKKTAAAPAKKRKRETAPGNAIDKVEKKKMMRTTNVCEAQAFLFSIGVFVSCIDDDDDDDDGGGGKGLFDDSDDEPDEKPKAAPMSKRERMEALQAKKRHENRPAPSAAAASKPKKDPSKKKQPKEDGAESDGGESFDSAEYVRTKEDNDFIDADDDDPDALNELYAEQHFGDDHPEMEEGKGKHKKGSGRKSRGDDDDRDGRVGRITEADLDNPIMAAVHKMKRKKREQKKTGELEEEAKEFVHRMERAAEDDLQAIKERRPAVAKLNMLPQVVDMLAKRDMVRVLLDYDILSVCKIWIQPLPNGSLGNVTVRQELVQAIRKVQEINTDDLKKSEIGKVIMTLYMHPSETPALKREMKSLIEQWSRPIFQKSGNMKDLEHFQQSRQRSLQATTTTQRETNSASASAPSREADLQSMITSGSRGASSDHGNRVRVPYSKGFQYTVRPTAKTSTGESPAKGGGPKEGVRNNLVKRILEKGRPVVKNHRSANVSIEGRPTK